MISVFSSLKAVGDIEEQRVKSASSAYNYRLITAIYMYGKTSFRLVLNQDVKFKILSFCRKNKSPKTQNFSFLYENTLNT
jgi:hypothetical protein